MHKRHSRERHVARMIQSSRHGQRRDRKRRGQGTECLKALSQSEAQLCFPPRGSSRGIPFHRHLSQPSEKPAKHFAAKREMQRETSEPRWHKDALDHVVMTLPCWDSLAVRMWEVLQWKAWNMFHAVYTVPEHNRRITYLCLNTLILWCCTRSKRLSHRLGSAVVNKMISASRPFDRLFQAFVPNMSWAFVRARRGFISGEIGFPLDHSCTDVKSIENEAFCLARKGLGEVVFDVCICFSRLFQLAYGYQ